MKKVFISFPLLSRIVLAAILGIGALLLSSLIYSWGPVKTYFPFVAEGLLVGATWVLYRTDGQNLRALGLNVSLKNIFFLFFGLLTGFAAMGLATGLRTFYTGEVFHITSGIDGKTLLKSLYYILPTVAVQELMFRGYLFTKAVSAWGVVKANALFAVLFMLVHVLDEEVMQNGAQMMFLAVVIPVGHLWFAVALLRSKTLLFPIGLHWGNNWAVSHLVGNKDSQGFLLYTTGQKEFTTWPSFVILLLIFTGTFLLVTAAIWKWKPPLFAKGWV